MAQLEVRLDRVVEEAVKEHPMGETLYELTKAYGVGAISVARELARRPGFKTYVRPGSARTKYSTRVVAR